MVPSAVIEHVPIDSLWTGSEKILWTCTATDPDDGFPIRVLLCAALFLCIAVSKYLFPYLSEKILTVFRPIEYRTPLSFPFIASLVAITALSSFTLSGSLCFLSIAGTGHFPNIAIFCLLFICLKAVILILTQKASGAGCLMACLRATMVLLSSLACIAALFAMTALMFPDAIGSRAFTIALAACALIAVLLYLYKLTATLFSAKITPFYSFLYLCTLEFIPMSVLTVMLTRL